jgi:hypothetical protein
MKATSLILLLVAATLPARAQEPQVRQALQARQVLLDRAAQVQAVQAVPAQVLFEQAIQAPALQLGPARAVIRSTGLASSQPGNPTVQVDTRNVDSLSLTSGEILRGTFIGLEPGVGLKWKHEAIKETLSIAPAGVRSMRLEKPRPYKTPAHNSKLYLCNGDQLAGNLVRLDGTALRLETAYAGTLTIPREQVRTVMTLFRPVELFFEGPTSLEGWTQGGRGNGVAQQVLFNNGLADAAVAWAVQADGGPQQRDANQPSPSWQFKDGAFIATNPGGIGRQLKMPAPGANIEFDLDCSGYPQFTVQFFADALDRPYGANACVLQFSQRAIYAQRQTRPGSSRMVANGQWSPSAGQNHVHVSIRTHREQKLVALFLNDTLITKFTDSTEVGADANGLVFWQQGSVPIRISSIRVTEWDGTIEDAGAPVTADKEDGVVLLNKDKLAGKLLGVKEGKVQIKTAFADLNIPLERVSRFSLVSAKTAPVATANATRLYFKDFGRVTLNLERWNDQTVEGTSSVFGQSKINTAALKLVEFVVQ